jgi:hypothetical protein
MMAANWLVEHRKRLSAQPLAGYGTGESTSAEPTAIAALAACSVDLRDAAEVSCRRLLEAQNPDGSISVDLSTEGPFWPTSLACLAWRQFEKQWTAQYRDAYRRGIDFLLSFGGEKLEPSSAVGHNTQLVGWPWVQGTHSWLEPTAFALLALRHCGHAAHPRAIEAAELILDRLLPEGGANYGNTIVLQQYLRPHVLPSALCMVAMHRGLPLRQTQIDTYNYLRDQLQYPLGAISLAWTIQALCSEQLATASVPDEFASRCNSTIDLAVQRNQAAGYKMHPLNLLLLASQMQNSPLLDLPEFEIVRHDVRAS